MPDWSMLARRLAGRVVLPEEADIAHAFKQFSADQTLAAPEALIRCRSEEDVREAIAFVRALGGDFAVRSGGHCFADFSHSAHVIIDLGAMRTIEPCMRDGERRVRLGPGACGEHLVPALSPSGLAVPTGGCPTVAIGGLSLVGGFGMFGRRNGLAADRVRGFRVVLADGSAVDASAHTHPELFWALRGAGAAGFGVVTSLEVAVHDVPEATACLGTWPIGLAAELVERWQRFAPDAPACANLALALVAPDDPDVACIAQLHGLIFHDGPQREVHDALIAALGPLSSRLRTWRMGANDVAAYAAGLLDHAGKPAWQPSRPFRTHGFQVTRSHFFDRLVERPALDACIDALRSARAYALHREIELVPWGGAYATGSDGAFIHRHARMLVRHTAYTGARATEALRAEARRWCEASHAALSAHANGHAYQGYAERSLATWRRAYYGTHYPRLQAIKQRYDPDGAFRHPQSIETATAPSPASEAAGV